MRDGVSEWVSERGREWVSEGGREGLGMQLLEQEMLPMDA